MSRGHGMLHNKVLFLAGAGAKMGAAAARIAAREGARVALVARRTDVVQKTVEAIEAGGGSAIALRCDLAREEDIAAAVNATAAKFGPINAVFYNAAFYDHQNTDINIDPDLWRMSIDVNLNGPLALARLVMPSMLERGDGAFVFNSSGSSLVADDARVGYQVTKAGLNAVTRFIAGQYGRRGIRANAIMPFVTDGLAGGAAAAGVGAAAVNCLGRSGTADEIGEAVAFLLSDKASIITGQMIHLDGGLFARAPWKPVSQPLT